MLLGWVPGTATFANAVKRRPTAQRLKAGSLVLCLRIHELQVGL